MTSSITVAVAGHTEIARELGKKGTTSDLTLYNAVRDGHAATIVEPTQFPEKFAALLFAFGMADQIVLTIPALDKAVAEVAATADLFATPITLALGREVGEEELKRAFKGTRLAEAPVVPLEAPRLRDMIDGWTAPATSGSVRVPIDHAFPVKGVGAVALGVVRHGTLKVHDRLRLFPTDKTVEVRSIQVHDVDVPEAVTGDRVGMALKGVEADELSRGLELAPEGSRQVATEWKDVEFTPCRYYRGEIQAGAGWHALVGLQFVPVQITARRENWLDLAPDRPVAYAKGDPAYLADLSATSGPRIVGRAVL
jgi:selenocysteine-specific translation elongation factor